VGFSIRHTRLESNPSTPSRLRVGHVRQDSVGALFWYYVGLWIVVAMMGRDGEPLERIDYLVCLAYPLVYLLILYYVVCDLCDEA
jgi:hypothetical protein